MGSRDQLDAALLELGPEVRQLLLVELMLVRVRLEDLFLELSELLRLVDEGAGFQFSKLGQFSSLLLKLLQRTGAWLGATPTRTLSGRPVFLLQQDLPGFLVGQDLSLDPLERIVNRLRVAAQLLSHIFVRRPLQVET
jgi:hypothetical protein